MNGIMKFIMFNLIALGIAAVVYFGWLIVAALSDGKVKRPDWDECGGWGRGILIGAFILMAVFSIFS